MASKETEYVIPPHIQAVMSKPGERLCLKCQKTFNSPDVSRIRICSRCTADNADLFIKAEVNLGGEGSNAEPYET